MSDRRKRAADFVAGDKVVLTNPYCTGIVAEVRESASTPIKPRRGGTIANALIIIFDVIDGPMIGRREADFVHPEEPLLWP